MPRAPKHCGKPGCIETVVGRTYCPAHTPMHSGRRGRLPSNWASLRAQVRKRADGKCEAASHHPSCDGVGSECDHIRPGDDHSLSNLQWLSRPCHQAKSNRENRERNIRPRPKVPWEFD